MQVRQQSSGDRGLSRAWNTSERYYDSAFWRLGNSQLVNAVMEDLRRVRWFTQMAQNLRWRVHRCLYHLRPLSKISSALRALICILLI
jgi:hypothetical protein